MSSGPRVFVTRSRAQASALRGALEARGASVRELAALVVEQLPVDDAIRAVVTAPQACDLLVFTSGNGVRAFVEALAACNVDLEAWRDVPTAAAGSATAQAIVDAGLSTPRVPDVFVAEALAELLTPQVRNARVVLPRAREGRDVLPDTLRGAGASVVDLPVYATLPPTSGADELSDALDAGVDIVTVASSKTVRHLHELATNGLRARLRGVPFASIGPITSATARELGYNVVVESPEATVACLADAVLDWWHRSA